MSGRKRRADDPMVLIYTDESKLNIKGAKGLEGIWGPNRPNGSHRVIKI